MHKTFHSCAIIAEPRDISKKSKQRSNQIDFYILTNIHYVE